MMTRLRLLLTSAILLTFAVAHAQDITPTPVPSPVLAYLQGGSDGTHCGVVAVSSMDGAAQQQFTVPINNGCMSPLWSPDGAYLAVYHPGLILIEVETGEIIVLNDLTTGTIVDTPAWSTDGDYLAWHEQRGGDGANPTWNVLNVADGTVEASVDLSEIEVAPDTLELLQVTNGGLYLMTSSEEPLEVPLPEGLNCTSTLALFGNQFVCSDGDDLVLVDVQTGMLLNLTNTPTVEESNPHWSPDGQQIAYQTYEPTTRKTWLNSIQPDGTNGIQLTLPEGDAYDVRPLWSPDGLYIAFQRHSGPKGLTSEIYVMQADGSNVVKIGDGQAAAWQPAALTE